LRITAVVRNVSLVVETPAREASVSVIATAWETLFWSW
jgi:hypothetical protein